MARIKLYLEDLDDLPELCARSGEPATRRVTKTFSWHPQWVGLLLLISPVPYIIVAIVLTKRMTVAVPLCDRHANHWLMRTVLILGILVLLVVLGIMAGALLSDRREEPNAAGSVLCVVTVLGGFVWILVALILQQTAIQAGEITDESITLTGVSRVFANAVRQRQQAYEEEEEERPRYTRKPSREEPPETGFRE